MGKRVDVNEVIGKRYGKLTVKEFYCRDKRGKLYFVCECDCGNNTITRLDKLNSGRATSCGKCAKNNPEKYYQEYIGKVYGDVRIDKYSHTNKNCQPYFWCICLKCGEKFGPVYLGHLKSGHTTNCGKCAKNNPEKYYQEYIGKVYGDVRIDKYSHMEHKKPYFWCICLKCGEKFDKPVNIDSLKSRSIVGCRHCIEKLEIGKKYGYWTVKEFLYRDKRYTPYFLCECDCGNSKPVELGHLKSGRSTSCGCRTESKGEEKIRTMLEELEVKFEQEYTGFTDMKDKNVLRCDFWLPGFNRVIEFDGEFHYEEKKCFKDNPLEDTQRRDEIKNQYCWDHGIDIVRIPYWELDNIDYNDLVSSRSRFLVKKTV